MVLTTLYGGRVATGTVRVNYVYKYCVVKCSDPTTNKYRAHLVTPNIARMDQSLHGEHWTGAVHVLLVVVFKY